MQALNIWYICCSSAEKIVQFYWRRKCLVTPSLAGIHARVNFVVKWNTRTELWASVLFPNYSCVDLGSHVIILKQLLLLLESATLWSRFCWQAIVRCSFGPRWIFFISDMREPRRSPVGSGTLHMPAIRFIEDASCGHHVACPRSLPNKHIRARSTAGTINHLTIFGCGPEKEVKELFLPFSTDFKKKLICFWLGAISVIWHSWSF